MPGNPNMQKLGKRKAPPGTQNPAWLFPATKTPNPTTSSTSNSSTLSKIGQDKKVARDILERHAARESSKIEPPAELVNLVGSFLVENNFAQASKYFSSESKGRSKDAITSIPHSSPSLITIYNEWRKWKGTKHGTDERIQDAAAETILENDSSSSGDSGDSSETDEDSDVEMTEADSMKKTAAKATSSSSSSESESDTDEEEDDAPIVKMVLPNVKVNGLKRKATSPGSDSSSSASGSSSSSGSEDEAPRTKKVKTSAPISSPAKNSSGSSSDSDSESSAYSDSEMPKTQNPNQSKITSDNNSSGGSSSSSESESESESDSSTHSLAKKTPLPDSDDDSSSSESDPTQEKKAVKKQGSDTSATMSDSGAKKVTPTAMESSSDSSSSSDSEDEAKVAKAAAKTTTAKTRELSPPLPPNPTAKFSKKSNERFSRIPKDIKVNEQLSSNAFVPYDYAQKAHEDLIVTKGKGFTKEKNKKKRGSYKGGWIDIEGKKGIKFEN